VQGLAKKKRKEEIPVCRILSGYQPSHLIKNDGFGDLDPDDGGRVGPYHIRKF
jgi:hypothetical protein